MRKTQTLDCGLLVLDFDALCIELHVDDRDARFEATYASLAEMNAGYQARVAPFLENNDFYDINDGCTAAPIPDLAAYLAEERACAIPAPPEADTPLDTMVQEMAWELRIRLNRALGPDAIELENITFYLGDHGFSGVYVNPPLLAGADEPQLEKVLATHRYGGWLGEDFRNKAHWSLESEWVGDALEPYGDPSNLYDSAVTGLLYLVCAHLEARPNLRENVTVTDGFRATFVFHDMEGDVSVTSRELATRFVSKPASKFFDAWTD